MKYCVKIWCRDCLGEDQDGCFNGGYDYLRNTEKPWHPVVFGTKEDAEAKAKQWHDDLDVYTWEWEVVPMVRGVPT